MTEKFEEVNISELIGKTLFRIERRQIFYSLHHKKDDELYFYTTDKEVYRMSHEQDCCENVYIEDIAGDLEDLVGEPILSASEESNEQANPDRDDWEESDMKWTFYKLATIKGYVDIRWFGESNGYYSIVVEFMKRLPNS